MLRILFTILAFVATQTMYAQSTAQLVYDVIQAKCASCHGGNDPEANLVLDGNISEVLDNLVDVTPGNAHAIEQGYKHIYPGRPDKSFLFRKINQGLEETITLDNAVEDAAMPPYGSEPLTDEEKELIRQWILFGAPSTGAVVDPGLIDDFYNVNGLESFPDGAPTAPSAAEGFQVKMGPFYIEPGGEVEYFQKYELDLPSDLEVNRIDIIISNYSHHMLIYDFTPGGDEDIPAGLRPDPDHSNIGLVAAVQEATDLVLPPNTAFRWDEGLVLDLNSHYINYSATETYQSEVYLNVYTQPIGTAAQEMHTDLFANVLIFIPPNGDEVSFDQNITSGNGYKYIWGLMGHTHKAGTGYEIWTRENGQPSELIYDASCAGGIPGCVSPFYDYQHIPFTYYDPLLPVNFSNQEGLYHEASYVNDGPGLLTFGSTSDDEMMVAIAMYTLDTAGLTVNEEFIPDGLEQTLVFPNPMLDATTLNWPESVGTVDFELYDLQGRVVRSISNIDASYLQLERNDLPAGMYFYRLEDRNGQFTTGKILME